MNTWKRSVKPCPAKGRGRSAGASPKLALPLLALLSLIFLAAALLVLPPERREGPWRGWRLLFVPREIGEEKALAHLEAAGVQGILSESRQVLRLSSWDGELEDLPLGLVETKLLPDDPRFDDYVRGLKAWFQASSAEKKYRIFYIKGRPAIGRRDALAEATESLSPDALLLGGEALSSPFFDFSAPAAAILTGIGLVIARRKGRAYRVAAILPWLILAAFGTGGLLALVWAGLLTLLVLEIEPQLAEYRRSGSFRGFWHSLLHGSLSFFYLVVPAFGSLIASPRLAPSFFLGFLASASLLAAFVVYSKAKSRGKARKAFVALPIAETSWRMQRGAHKILVGACCCAAALGLALSIGGRFEGGEKSDFPGLMAPLPGRLESRALPLPESAAELASSSGEDGPPDLADWLIHRARQEALFLDPLGREDPNPFAPIGLPLPGGSYRTVLEFSEPWAKAAYRSLPELSIEALLRDQGGYRPASVRPIGSQGLQPLAPFDAILYILFLAFPLYGALSGLPRRERSGSVRNSYETP